MARYPGVRRVTLFGSRAIGTFGHGSDIDLALEGPDLTPRALTRITTDLEDSDLPYKVDLLLRNDQLEPNLEAHIRRHGKPFGWRRCRCNNHPANRGGMTKIIEAVRQLRGEAHPAVQVKDCALALAQGIGGLLGACHGSATLIIERE